MKAKAAARPAVPAEAVEVDRVGLRRVDADVERDVLVLVDAGRRGVALDLLVRIVRQLRPQPAAGAWLLVLQDDRIGTRGLPRSRRERSGRAGMAAMSAMPSRLLSSRPIVRSRRIGFTSTRFMTVLGQVASSRRPLRTDRGRGGGSHITRSRANHSWQTRQRVRGVNQPRAEISARDMFVRIEEWRSSGSACRTTGRAHASRLTARPTISGEIRSIQSATKSPACLLSRLRKVMFLTTFFTRSVAVSLPCARRGEVNDHPFSEDQAKVHCHRVAGKPCG